MLKSLLITAWRNIFRNPSFSLINMIGLSISMSLGLLVIMIIKEQYSYDTYHTDADRIYRINTKAIRVAGGTEDYASTPLPFASVIKDDYSFAEEVVRISKRLRGDAIHESVNVPLEGLFVDPSFLHVFNFPLAAGNPTNVLDDPGSIVLTQESAKKIFGDKNALGETINFPSYGEFTVTGVLEQLPGKTHFEFEALASLNALPYLEQQGILTASLDNWNNYYGNYVYFKLKEGRSIAEAEEALQAINKKYYTGLKLETRDKGYEFFLMPLASITPGPAMSNQMGTGMPVLLIIFLSTLVAIVMVMACFNYTNLMIAKSLKRAKEIGVRKIVGAKRIQVFFQFISEAVVFSVICLLLSYIFLQALRPAFMQLSIAQEFNTSLKEDLSVYALFLLFTLSIGVFAGALPAFYLSAFKPLSVLKDTGGVKAFSTLTFRKVLLVVQFTLSIVFILVVMVIYQQINFMMTKDYGFQENDIMNVRLQGMTYEKFAAEVRNIAGVEQVGGVSHALGTWADRSSDYKRHVEDESFTMRDFIVDDQYIANLKLQFVAGKNFNAAEQNTTEKHVILNEQALQLFGFDDAHSAIGHTIIAQDSLSLMVIGVVKDFHFRPLSYAIGPVALRYNLNELAYASMKINPSQTDAITAKLTTLWKNLDPIHPLQWKMMEDEIDDAYKQAGLTDVLTMVGYISFLAIMLACLGMLGMAMYSAQTRIKEIGVRKVMGATQAQLVMLLSRSFVILLGIAAIAGIPFGYFISQWFLSSYAYKIEITPLLIFTGLAIVALVGFATIASQTWKAAAANPVKSIRYE